MPFWKNLSLLSLCLTMIHYALVFFPSTISAAVPLFTKYHKNFSYTCTSKRCLRISNVWHGKLQKKGEEKMWLVYWDAFYMLYFHLLSCSLLFEKKIGISCVCIYIYIYIEKFVTLHWKVLNYFHVTSLLTFYNIFRIYIHMNMSKRMFQKWRGRKNKIQIN